MTTYEKPTVFISYNQKSGDDIVDQIQKRLEPVAQVFRDKTSIPDWGSIENFMKSIRKQDLVIMVITAAYLKSYGCMFEAAQAMKDEGWFEHTMFVVADDAADIYISKKWPLYFEYWKQEATDLMSAAEYGEKEAQCALALMYLEGRGVFKDIETAISWYQSAAHGKHGYSIAQRALGLLYLEQKDYQMAFKWFMTAEKLDSDSQAYLGYMYENGLGVKQNYETAVSWYRKSSKWSPWGQFYLGNMYEKGRGVPQSDKEAAIWYQKAANSDIAEAQERLAGIYKKRGDYIKANEWYQRAKMNK